MASSQQDSVQPGKKGARQFLVDALRKVNPSSVLDFVRGAGMGLTTDVLGYPVDTMTTLLRPLGYDVEKPVGGSDWIAEKVTAPTGSTAETAGRVASGFATPSAMDVTRLVGALRRGPIQELTTYHGSPHRINNVDEQNPLGKFDLSKVGTGEGAQAYGHGVYLAESPDVAKGYATKLSDRQVYIDGKPIGGDTAPIGQTANNQYAIRQLASADTVQGALLSKNGDLEAAIASAESFAPKHKSYARLAEELKALRGKSVEVRSGGHFYTVDLPDEHIAKMLDWDAPLSEQPEVVRAALKDYAAADDATISGGEFYRRLIQEMGAEPEEVSQALRSAGIPGIRYLDGNSRVSSYSPQTEGTRNFVIFDPEVAKILKRE